MAIGFTSIPIFAADQREIQAQGPEGALRGTITRAQIPDSPLALIIPGSGPIDRDGNSFLGLRINTYRLLAEGLATQGVSTVRIDKRGMYGSVAAIKNPNAVTINDYAFDIKTWVAAIRKETDARCVWLIGHSEGGLVSLVAAQHLPELCGLVLVAAPGRSLGLILREQLESNPANASILDDAKSIISKLEAGNKIEAASMNPVLLPLFHPDVQDFLISQLTLDPAKLIAQVKKPVLILQGLRDIQVSANNAVLLKEANPNAEIKWLENTNHILRTVKSDDRSVNLQTYSDISLPLADGVIDSISAFIQKH